MKGKVAMLLAYRAQASSFALDLILPDDSRKEGWVYLNDDGESIGKSSMRDLLEDLVGKTMSYMFGQDGDEVLRISAVAEPESALYTDRLNRPPPKVFRCGLCFEPLKDDSSVGLVADDGPGGIRFTAHVGCEPFWRRALDEDEETLGVF